MKFGILMLWIILTLGLSGCAARMPSENRAIHMKLMTYNIRVGKGGGEWNYDTSKVDLEPVAKLIKQEQPDLVGLQEVDRYRKRTALMDQPAQLADRLKMHITYQPAYITEVPGAQNEEYGNALLSRLHIESSHKISLFKPDYSKSNPEYPDYYSEQRGLLHAEVRIEGTSVHVFATHLGLTADQREKQIAQILETMSKFSGPKVLFGDFNAEPTEPAMQLLGTQYTDVLSAAHVTAENRKSYPAGLNPTGAIDYIFVSSEFKVLNAKVLRDTTLASDHNPVVAEVTLTPHK